VLESVSWYLATDFAQALAQRLVLWLIYGLAVALALELVLIQNHRCTGITLHMHLSGTAAEAVLMP